MTTTELARKDAVLRILTARVFTAYVDSSDGGRQSFCAKRGWDEMPTIIPAHERTSSGDIRAAAERHIAEGESVVAIPVLRDVDGCLQIAVLSIKRGESAGFWAVSCDEVHPDSTMGELVDALDPGKSWSISDLDESAESLIRRTASV